VAKQKNENTIHIQPKNAPIILFVFNRPLHTQKTLENLSRNGLAPLSDLYIYSDGPRNEKDLTEVNRVRNVISAVRGFRNIHIVERVSNLGLADSILIGVAQVLQSHDRVIVLEDDLVVNLHFLSYMNRALAQYADNEKVASIHAWNFPLTGKLPSTFFLRGADCWGWGTWRRAWEKFETDGSKLLKVLKQRKLTKPFDLDGAYPYTKMLKNQIKRKNNSWAIRWHASMYVNDMLTLHPGESLVKNIGLDGSGVHSKPADFLMTNLSERQTWSFPHSVTEDSEMRSRIIGYLREHQLKLTFLQKVGYRLKSYYGRVIARLFAGPDIS
jgi:hypothetical protein